MLGQNVRFEIRAVGPAKHFDRRPAVPVDVVAVVPGADRHMQGIRQMPTRSAAFFELCGARPGATRSCSGTQGFDELGRRNMEGPQSSRLFMRDVLLLVLNESPRTSSAR